MTTTLVLIGVTFYGYQVVLDWENKLRGQFELEAFLDVDVDSTKVVVLERLINNIQEVKSTSIISKEHAAARYSVQFGDDLVELLGYNPLPMSIVIKMKESINNLENWRNASTIIENFEGVDEVVYEGEILAKLERLYQKAGKILIISSVSLLIISLIFTALTVAGSIKSREQFIRIIVMSGGSNRMAKGPFRAMSAFYGLTAGIIATIMITGLHLTITTLGGSELIVQIYWIPAALLSTGVLFAVICGSWVIRKYIRY